MQGGEGDILVKKSHTCEEGGAHLRPQNFFLLFTDELEKQIPQNFFLVFIDELEKQIII